MRLVLFKPDYSVNILTWPSWGKLLLLIVVGVIIIVLIRGCHNSKAALAENNSLHIANDSLIKRIKNDSIGYHNTAADYQIKSQLQESVITIQENKLQAAYDTLDRANDRIKQLLARYKPVAPNADTNITTVDNSYIQDCAQCFTELEGQQQREKVIKAQADILQQSLNSKINTQQLRIDQLGREQAQANKNLNDCRAITDGYQKKLELRRRLYFSMGVMSINTIFPNAAGLGLMYQDKRYRIVGFRMYTSEYGSVKALDIHMPLSFK